jgi:membrane protease YdiL (CAAX protease family)
MTTKFFPRVLPLKATSQSSSKQVLRAPGVPSFRVTRGKKLNKGPTDPGRNLGSPARLIITTLLIFLVSQIIAAFIAELGLAIIHPNSHQVLDNSVAAQFVYILIAEGLAAYFVFLIVKRRGLGLSAIGLGRKPNRSDLIRAAIGFGAFYVLLITASVVINAISPDLTNQKQNVGFDNLNSGLETAVAFISLVILPPLGEEILVRGYLYSGLRKVMRFFPALLVTSLLFGAAHLQVGGGTALVWAAAIDTFLLSIVLVYLREKTGALYAGMVVHMLNNLLAFFVVIK